MARTFGKGKTLARASLWQGSVGDFGEERVQLPDGREMTLAILKHPGAAAVVPFLNEREIVLLRQYRHAAGETLWEVPAGKLDDGEDPRLCAARELTEETGYVAGKVERVGSIYTTPGFTDEVIHLFVAYDLREGSSALEADEVIETSSMPLSEALELIDRGEIRDAKTICALFQAARAHPVDPQS
ncbi:MAG: NUDIX hydrolase [Myxococcales bacterium]|nr:NUDIX hydrolase [Myxococcales bacterium]MDD9967553.1 NUDIX hydrolase [Myxococcales bacterium]